MKNLTLNELTSINGGQYAPHVSRDPAVQGGYSLGWHIGHAIGETIRQFKSIFS